MPKNISDSERRTPVDGYSRLLTHVASGRLERLPCPQCDLPSVSVCFAHHHAGEYRTWFICTSCDFQSRAHNTRKPSTPRNLSATPRPPASPL